MAQQNPSPCAFVIFGITGNLSQIKLIPALYDLIAKNLLSPQSRIIGIGRAHLTRPQFETYIHKVLHTPNHHHEHPIDPAIENQLIKQMLYVQGNVDANHQDSVYPRLKQTLKKLSSCNQNYLYYLATYPSLYQTIFESLKHHRLYTSPGWVRLMIEKPMGHDLLSAKKLDQLLHRYFKENQIYRLDHYLGKETLQHLLTFRFGNGLFEDNVNADGLDHIQITAAEAFGIGERGGYYDQVGALKDVGQNHQLQMLAFATMEAPSEFTNVAVTAERLKIISTLVPDPANLVLGQYQGYRQENHVAPRSKTDTFYALKTEIATDRFRGVPVYIRGGKRLPITAAEITLVFKTPQNRLFNDITGSPFTNMLIYRVQPNEGIGIRFLAKVPGHQMRVKSELLQYCYHTSMPEIPDAYEKLLYATMTGDQTFFNDASEVEAQWAFVDHLLETKHKVHPYAQNTWGPAAADKLIEKDNRHWLNPSPDLCRI